MQFDDILAAVPELDLKQIHTLMGELAAAEKGIKQQRIVTVKAEIEAKLAAEGLSLADITGGAGKGRKALPKSKLPAKYRDTANAANEWSGRGRIPNWLQGYIEAGRDKEDFLIG